MNQPSCSVCGALRLGDQAECPLCTHKEYPYQEPTMTEHNLALQLSLLAWMNMEEFINGGYEKDTLLLICKNNIAVLKELKGSE